MTHWSVVTIKTAFWVAGAVLLGAVLILTAHLSGNSLEFSRYNPNWNGTSQFFSDLDRHHTSEILDPAQLSAYHSTGLLLIIAPLRPPTSGEITAYRTFLEQGNTILLADDFGNGNAILEGLGSRVTLMPGNLSSVDREYADSYSVVVYRVTNATPVQSVTSLVLNRPAPLEGGKSLMATSIMSWVDANGDRRINTNELLGKFSVMTTEDIGPGRLIVLSDPSIFINSMQDIDEKWDNHRLIETIVNHNGPVLIDQMNSRTADTEGISGMLHVIRTTFIITILCVVVLVLVVAMAWKRKFL
jgi:hypothetical protein